MPASKFSESNGFSVASEAEHARTVLENTQDVAFIVSRDLRITYVNERASEVTGLDRKMIVGRPIELLKKARITDDEHLQEVQRHLVDLIQGRKSHCAFVMPIRVEEMGTVRAHVRLSAVSGGDRVEQVVGLVRRLPGEGEPVSTDYADMDLPFQRIIDRFPTAACVCSRGAVLYTNDRFQEMMVFNREELLKKRGFTTLAHFGDQSRVDRILDQLLLGERSSDEFHCRLKSGDEHVLPTRVFASRIVHEGKAAVSLTVIVDEG
jgi:PAS domain S-box-containing protein